MFSNIRIFQGKKWIGNHRSIWAGGICFYAEELTQLTIFILLLKHKGLLMQAPNVFCFTLKSNTYITALLKGETERRNGGNSVEESMSLM